MSEIRLGDKIRICDRCTLGDMIVIGFMGVVMTELECEYCLAQKIELNDEVQKSIKERSDRSASR